MNTSIPKKPSAAIASADRAGWLQRLAVRHAPLEPWLVIPWRRAWPLGWAWPADIADSPTAHLVQRLERFARRRPPTARDLAKELELWLATAGQRVVDHRLAWECLGWAYVLPPLAGVLSTDSWFELLDFLAGLAELAAGTHGGLTPAARTSGGRRRQPGKPKPLARGLAPAEDLLCRHVLGGELPLTLGYLFPELTACRELGRQARAGLSAGLPACIDESGLPAAQQLASMRPLLACWTRCGHLTRTRRAAGWDEPAWRRYAQFVRRALQLTRPDGTQVLAELPHRDDGRSAPAGTASASEGPTAELFAAALRLIDDEEVEAIAQQVLPRRRPARSSGLAAAAWAEPAVHSEPARIAVLRPDWRRGGEHLVVTYDGPTLRAELNCGSATVWSGVWNPAVIVEGTSLEPTGDWRDLCWFSDDDVDYLELELGFEGGWRVQRQIMLARQDRFLYVADALCGARTARDIDYRLTLPLTSAMRFEAAGQTREGYLVKRRSSGQAVQEPGSATPAAKADRLGLVLPLALPEWRTAGAEGSLVFKDAQLELRQQGQGSRLYAPLFIDLDRRRFACTATWRQLTVAQELQSQPRSVAVGYRVQLGREQWLFYRSLADPANRTVLGQNVTAEFYAGRFDSDGEADELIRIERDA